MFKRIAQSIFLPFIFWIIAFGILKSFFLLHHYASYSNSPFSSVLAVFTEALRLDIASATYFMCIPVVALLVQFVTKKQFFSQFALIYHGALIGISTLINTLDIELYKHWQTKLNVKVLLYFNHPESVLKANDPATLFFLTFLFLFVSLILFQLYRNKFHKEYTNVPFNWKKWVVSALLLVSMSIIGIRGGLQEIPVNQSDAYFSSNPTLNYAGVNSIWNVGNSIFQNKKYINTNRYRSMDEAQALEFTNELFQEEQDSTTQLWEGTPNFVYIAFEGINANCIEDYSSKYARMPEFSKIAKEGYLFKNMYSSGQRTDQGLVAILSGFPAMPLNTISAQPEKYAKLPSLALELQKLGYNCNFYCSSEPEFGSFKSYLVHNNFSPIIDIHDFPAKEVTQKLGAPDEFLFNKFNSEMQQVEEPFFSLMLTTTSHEPFDMPFNDNVSDATSKYLNTVSYTDSVFGNWWKEVQQMPWYANTIFIITSDHAHPQPGNYWYSDQERYHIPFLILGEPLKPIYKGAINDVLCNQTDIPATILAQQGIDYDAFKWSKNFMNPYQDPFSFFIFIDGFTYRTPDYICAWEYRYKKVQEMEVSNPKDSTECLTIGKAYMQQVFQEYLDY